MERAALDRADVLLADSRWLRLLAAVRFADSFPFFSTVTSRDEAATAGAGDNKVMSSSVTANV